MYAVANQYQWDKQDTLDRLGGDFSATAISANGNHLILSVIEGGENSNQLSPLFVSNNYGVSWQDVASEIDENVRQYWASVDVSNDGQTMVAASDFGRDLDTNNNVSGKIVVSEDGGSSWTDVTPEDSDEWTEVVVSGDGSTIAAVRDSSDLLFVSEMVVIIGTPSILIMHIVFTQYQYLIMEVRL